MQRDTTEATGTHGWLRVVARAAQVRLTLPHTTGLRLTLLVQSSPSGPTLRSPPRSEAQHEACAGWRGGGGWSGESGGQQQAKLEIKPVAKGEAKPKVTFTDEDSAATIWANSPGGSDTCIQGLQSPM